MKINSIQHDMTLKQGNSRLRSESQKFRENNAGAYENRGYNAGYCGSFTGKSEAAATVMKKSGLFTKNWFNKFLTYSYEHNVSTSALVALVLAGVLRPATIMALPGDKDKEDKIYASGHAMASAILGFVASTIITSPLDTSIKKVFGDPAKYGSKKLTKFARIKDALQKRSELRNSAGELLNKTSKQLYKKMIKHQDTMQTLAKNIPDWIIAVPRSILTIALIPPILKYVFGVEKKKKSDPPKQENVNTVENKMETPQMDFINKSAFQDFKGGVK